MTPYATPKVSLVSVFILLLIIAIPLLVLFIRLCIKKPKIAAIIALVPLVFIASVVSLEFYSASRSHQIIAPVREITNYSNNGRVEQIIRYPNSSNQSAIINNSSANQSPIWSEGIEDQFQADVYPSGISALRALAPRVVKQIPYVMGESGSPEAIVIYSDSQATEIVEEFRQAMSKLMPEIKCRIEIGNVEIEPKEVGIRFSLQMSNGITYPIVQNATNVPPSLGTSMVSLKTEGASGTVQANIFCGPRQSSISTKYNNKFWIENFSDYVNRNPEHQYIIAKSNETCLTPEEADKEAIKDACYQVKQLLINSKNSANLNYNYLSNSGMVKDRFVQSLDGSVGKIWRQAILLDVSNQKLNHLADILSGAARTRSLDWARMIFSIIGLFVLITIVYIFLNAATRGYYSWSLRIAGVILAAIFLIIILKIT